jgi:hypothetical protein
MLAMLFDCAERKHNQGGAGESVDLLPSHILPEHDFLTGSLAKPP